jgi:SsrA-binding protein
MSYIAENRKAYFDYFIEEEFEAGIQLTGSEVKACRTQGASLVGSYVRIYRNEPYVLGLKIPLYAKSGGNEKYDPERSRKLLLRRGEINSLIGALSRKGYSATPLRLYKDGDLIKIKIGIVRGKKEYDKREILKKREQLREMERSKKVF